MALGQPWRNGAHMSHPKAAEGLVDNAAPQFVDLEVPAHSEIRESVASWDVWSSSTP